jgi:hypothetical protein
MSMAMNDFELMLDRRAVNAQLPSPPRYIEQAVCAAAATPENIAIPSGARVVIFTSDGNFWCKPGASAGSRPTGDTTDGTAWDFNPVGYWLGAGFDGVALTHLRVEAPIAGTTVVAKFYT